MKKYQNLALLAAVGAGLSAVLTGCGSGGTTNATDRSAGVVDVTVDWPEANSRLIPEASLSIQLELLDSSGNSLTPPKVATINRPTTTASITDVPAGSKILRAVAYPEYSAQGVGQAAGQTTCTVTAGGITTVPLTLDSTITKVTVTPNPAGVEAGETVQLTATAQDSASQTVLVADGSLSWTVSSGSSAAQVNSSGLVTGLAAGTATIRVTEADSGGSGTAVITVTDSTPTTGTVNAVIQ